MEVRGRYPARVGGVIARPQRATGNGDGVIPDVDDRPVEERTPDPAEQTVHLGIVEIAHLPDLQGAEVFPVEAAGLHDLIGSRMEEQDMQHRAVGLIEGEEQRLDPGRRGVFEPYSFTWVETWSDAASRSVNQVQGDLELITVIQREMPVFSPPWKKPARNFKALLQTQRSWIP